MSKYRESSSRTSSGSRDSDMAVKPTRSANITETVRRSATTVAAAGRCCAGILVRESASAVPHSPQNFWVPADVVPQELQTTSSRAPHSPQNFCAASLSAEQAGQTIDAALRLSSHLKLLRPAPADRGFVTFAGTVLARNGLSRIGLSQNGLDQKKTLRRPSSSL